MAWGIDQIVQSVTERELPRAVSEMNLAEVNFWLLEHDRELSHLEEETDRHDLMGLGARKEPEREEKYKRATELKERINATGGVYDQLIGRFETLATTEVERRAVKVRRDRKLYDGVHGSQAFNSEHEKAAAAYKQPLIVPDVGSLTMSDFRREMKGNPDGETRRRIFVASTQLDGLESAFADERAAHNRQVIAFAGGRVANIFDVQAEWYEAPKAHEIGAVLLRFVEGTKDIYDALMRELLGEGPLEPWDVQFLLATKDPFAGLDVPQNPVVLLRNSIDLFVRMGYDRKTLERLYDPRNPNVLLDIEERQGKRPQAVSLSLGAFSDGKNGLFFDPVSYSTDSRKRAGIFPHEMGHFMDFEACRRAAQEDPSFFFQPVNGSESFSMTHDLAPFDPVHLREHYGVSDTRLIEKWTLLQHLFELYSTVEITLMDVALSTCGRSELRTAAREARELVRPANVRRHDPGTWYTTVAHLWNQPGYYQAYFWGRSNGLAIAATIIDQSGTLLTPNTERFLRERVMTGNRIPIQQRVAAATGIQDPVQGTINYIRKEYRRLAA
ncbi:MAG: hypothetical protein Q7S65_05780 [Nanoarchaeota archaeon]|nr:hypothetical protein [Nanoarchaeota archaeon]